MSASVKMVCSAWSMLGTLGRRKQLRSIDYSLARGLCTVFSSKNSQSATKSLEEFCIYNTMTKQKEIFKPKEPGLVRMYVCGITSYDYCHLGHAWANVAFDVLYRYLKYLGYEVTYVRNFTDVDDKIIQRANKTKRKKVVPNGEKEDSDVQKEDPNGETEDSDEEMEDPLALSSRFIHEFIYDMDMLQCLHPTHQPRVSDHITEIIDMIKQIIGNGCAYAAQGDVYFSVDKFPEYGRLSRRKLEDNQAGKRCAVEPGKQNPADFALWKAAKAGEPSWDSPWGPGRPGWHIECSAMSAHYLTSSFDIHGGGIDLIFPHHENEIAQSWAACPNANVRYWIHNGHMTVGNVKMGKSLGNFKHIREVTNHYHPLALRYFFLGTHYRSFVNYSTSQLEIASDSIFYIYQTLRDCEEILSSIEIKSTKAEKPRVTCEEAQEYKDLLQDFKKKMSDDLHTPSVLTSTLEESLRYLNTTLKKLKKSKQVGATLVLPFCAMKEAVKKILDTLGLLPSSSTYPEVLSLVLNDLKERALKKAGLTEDDVRSFIEERDQARKNKDYNKSDQIRSELVAKGIDLMDEGKETIWRPRFRVENNIS